MPETKESDSNSQCPKRAACNRCHAQKLRCVPDPSAASCVRCRRIGAKCIYSPPRRMGRPRAQPPRDNPACDVPQTQTSETVTAEGNSRPLSVNSPAEDAQQHVYHQDKSRDDSIAEILEDRTNALGHNSASEADRNLTIDQTMGDQEALALFDDFSLLGTPPATFLSPSQWSDELSMAGVLPTGNGLNNSMKSIDVFQQTNYILDLPATMPGYAGEEIGTSMIQNKDLANKTSTEDEQIQKLSSLSFTLFKCKQSVLTCASSKGFQDILHCFSLSPTPSDGVQIDQVLEHTRMLYEVLSSLWGGSAIGPESGDRATVLLGVSCYLRLLQLYDILLANLDHSLKVLNTLPKMSEIHIGCFVLSSAQSLQLVLCMVAKLITELQRLVRKVLASAINHNPPHPWEPAPHPRTGRSEVLEETVNEIKHLEEDIQEKIKIINNGLVGARDTSHGFLQ